MTVATATPRDEELELSKAGFDKRVALELSEILRIEVPYPHVIEAGKPTWHIDLKFGVNINQNRRDFLRSRGYEIVKESEGRTRMDRGSVRWWFRDGHMALSFHARWSRTEDGISVYLETWPISGGGNEEEAVELARLLKRNGVKLPPLVERFVKADGKLSFGWDELGIEKNVPLWDVWQWFLSNYLHTNAERWLITQVAETRLVTPLSPSPFNWNSNSGVDPGRPYGTTAFVPESKKEKLLDAWQSQYTLFLNQMHPRRPS